MSNPILVTGAAGGYQGSTGKLVVQLLVQRGLSVRALVHRLDERSKPLRELGVEVIAGDLLDPDLVRQATQGIKRAYFTYPVDDGLLEATTIFARAAQEASTELVVNMSQLQNTPVAASFRNLQHRLADQIFDWAQVGAVHLNAPPFFERGVRSHDFYLGAHDVFEFHSVLSVSLFRFARGLVSGRVVTTWTQIGVSWRKRKFTTNRVSF